MFGYEPYPSWLASVLLPLLAALLCRHRQSRGETFLFSAVFPEVERKSKERGLTTKDQIMLLSVELLPDSMAFELAHHLSWLWA